MRWRWRSCRAKEWRGGALVVRIWPEADGKAPAMVVDGGREEGIGLVQGCKGEG